MKTKRLLPKLYIQTTLGAGGLIRANVSLSSNGAFHADLGCREGYHKSIPRARAEALLAEAEAIAWADAARHLQRLLYQASRRATKARKAANLFNQSLDSKS